MRTASTWTFACLDAHPDVAFPGGKQIHFWDKQRDLGLDWYRQLFASSPMAHTGEITPAYALLDDATVGELASTFPDLRTFFVVRDPVERAWSSVRLHLRRNDIDPATAPIEVLQKRLEGNGIRRRNAYAPTIDTWRRHFGEHFAVFDYVQLRSDPISFLVALAEHLGVDPVPFTAPSATMAARLAEPLNVAPALPMPDALRDDARERFAEDIDWYSRFSASQNEKPA